MYLQVLIKIYTYIFTRPRKVRVLPAPREDVENSDFQRALLLKKNL